MARLKKGIYQLHDTSIIKVWCLMLVLRQLLNTGCDNQPCFT